LATAKFKFNWITPFKAGIKHFPISKCPLRNLPHITFHIKEARSHRPHKLQYASVGFSYSFIIVPDHWPYFMQEYITVPDTMKLSFDNSAYFLFLCQTVPVLEFLSSFNQNLIIQDKRDFVKLSIYRKYEIYPIVDFDAVSFVSLDVTCFWLVLKQ
jgi:hypothetical protein